MDRPDTKVHSVLSGSRFQFGRGQNHDYFLTVEDLMNRNVLGCELEKAKQYGSKNLDLSKALTQYYDIINLVSPLTERAMTDMLGEAGRFLAPRRYSEGMKDQAITKIAEYLNKYHPQSRNGDICREQATEWLEEHLKYAADFVRHSVGVSQPAKHPQQKGWAING